MEKIYPIFTSLLKVILLTSIAISCNTEATTPTFTLTTSVSPAEGGSVSPARGSFDNGTAVSLQATPNDGWQFTEWQGDRLPEAVIQLLIKLPGGDCRNNR